MYVYCRSQPLKEEEKREFYFACDQKRDLAKVKQILCEVKPEQLLELLQWRGKTTGRTALDCCLETIADEECISAITEHVMENFPNIELLSIVFPYTGGKHLY